MRKIPYLVLFVFFSLWLNALPRNEKECRLLAYEFIHQHGLKAISTSDELSLIHIDEAITTRSSSATPMYYIYNIGQEKGFVIVSGDDCVKEILAYSDQGSIQPNQLPPNTRYWLDFYKKEIEFAIANDFPSIKPSILRSDSEENIISPLLGNISWNQGEPYNLLCPMDGSKQSVTGCVATAMAMLMKYYEYPKQGIGSHTYHAATINQTLSANFGNTVYDWQHMTPIYNAASSDVEKKAVATLMYHCGVSVEMNYSSKESGAIQSKIMTALIDFFGYNPNMYMAGRDYNTLIQWEDLIMKELKAKRPIPYNGRSESGGHSFLLDGRDASGKYHFNWGWGGHANGYYEITSLSPGSGGIGSGSGSYNTDQHIILGAQPETTGEFKSNFEIAGEMKASKLTYQKNEEIQVVFDAIWNYSVTFNGKVGLAFYKKGEFVCFLNKPLDVSLNTGWGWKDITFKGVIPEEVTDGTYELYLASQMDGEKSPSIVKAPTTTFSFYNVAISGNTISLTSPSIYSVLTQENKVIIDGSIYQGKEATFFVDIKNDGVEYYDEIGVYIRKTNALTYQRLVTKEVIANGETKTIKVSGIINLPPGTYRAVGSYKEGTAWKQFNISEQGVEFEIRDIPDAITQIEEKEDLVYLSKEGVLHITSTSPVETVNIYDINGKKAGVYSCGKRDIVEIDISHLARGVYIITFKTNSGNIYSHKVRH